MATNEGEGSKSTQTDEEQLVQDLLAKVNQCAEQYKKSMEESKNAKQEDDGSELDLLVRSEKFLYQFAELAKAIEKPKYREKVIEALEKETKSSEDYGLNMTDLAIGCFEQMEQIFRSFMAKMESVLQDVRTRKQEVSQQVIESKDEKNP